MVWEVTKLDIIDLLVACTIFVCAVTGCGGVLGSYLRDRIRMRRAVRRIHAEPRRRSREDYWRDTL